METLNAISVDSIVFLQSRLPASSYSYALSTLRYTDPSLILTLYFPILSSLSPSHGSHMISAMVYCDLAVMVLHWVLASTRPFWWIHESAYYLNKDYFPDLNQFPLTCETGPANPSASTALNAAAVFVITKALLAGASELLRIIHREDILVIVHRIIWLCFGILTTAEVTSHIYLASHFPYQCFLGVAIGVGAALWTSNDVKLIAQPKNIPYMKLFMLISLGLASALGSIYSEVYSDSILKAIRWCSRREFIVISPTPLHPVCRLIGLTAGMVVSSRFPKWHAKDFQRFTRKMIFSGIILAVAVGQTAWFSLHLLNGLPIWLYYVLVVAIHSSLIYFIVNFIPSLVLKSSGVKPVKLVTIISKP